MKSTEETGRIFLFIFKKWRKEPSQKTDENTNGDHGRNVEIETRSKWSPLGFGDDAVSNHLILECIQSLIRVLTLAISRREELSVSMPLLATRNVQSILYGHSGVSCYMFVYTYNTVSNKCKHLAAKWLTTIGYYSLSVRSSVMRRPLHKRIRDENRKKRKKKRKGIFRFPGREIRVKWTSAVSLESCRTGRRVEGRRTVSRRRADRRHVRRQRLQFVLFPNCKQN